MNSAWQVQILDEAVLYFRSNDHVKGTKISLVVLDPIIVPKDPAAQFNPSELNFLSSFVIYIESSVFSS